MEPVFATPCPDDGFGKAAEGHEAALFGRVEHRPPERAFQVADIGDVLGHRRARTFAGERERHAPDHLVDDRAARICVVADHRRLAPGPDVIFQNGIWGWRDLRAPRDELAPGRQQMLRAGDIAVMVAHRRRLPLAAYGVNKDAKTVARRSAPAAAATCIITCKALIDQYVAKAPAAARQYAQFAAIAVCVAVNWLQREGTCVDELVHPDGGLGPQFSLGGAARLVRFGGVDICNADLGPLIPDGVAIDDAVGAPAAMAKAESGGFLIGRAGRYGGRAR